MKTKRARGLFGWILIGVFRVYQLSLSPLLYALGVRCRHLPSCSAYAIDAVSAQGGWRGGWLAVGRICRCRPGGTHGFDPAPHSCVDVPWWSVWRFRSPFRSDEINTLPPADHADDKDEDQ